MVFCWLYPKRCCGCQKEGTWLCASCQDKLILARAKFYPLKPLNNQASVFKYQGAVKNLIYKFKYRFVREAGDILINQALKRIKTTPHLKRFFRIAGEQKAILIPISLHWYRFNWRGFNQAEIIAQALADEFGLKMDKRILLRPRLTWAQADLDRSDRQKNIQKAFELEPYRQIKHKSFLLVDDVLTSGETIKSAAELFRKRQADWLGAFSLAG